MILMNMPAMVSSICPVSLQSDGYKSLKEVFAQTNNLPIDFFETCNPCRISKLWTGISCSAKSVSEIDLRAKRLTGFCFVTFLVIICARFPVSFRFCQLDSVAHNNDCRIFAK